MRSYPNGIYDKVTTKTSITRNVRFVALCSLGSSFLASYIMSRIAPSFFLDRFTPGHGDMIFFKLKKVHSIFRRALRPLLFDVLVGPQSSRFLPFDLGPS